MINKDPNNFFEDNFNSGIGEQYSTRAYDNFISILSPQYWNMMLIVHKNIFSYLKIGLFFYSRYVGKRSAKSVILGYFLVFYAKNSPFHRKQETINCDFLKIQPYNYTYQKSIWEMVKNWRQDNFFGIVSVNCSSDLEPRHIPIWHLTNIMVLPYRFT